MIHIHIELIINKFNYMDKQLEMFLYFEINMDINNILIPTIPNIFISWNN